MGNKPVKDDTKSQEAAKTRKPKGSTKHVSLLVLHNKPQRPEMIHFCRALNAYPPPSSMAITNPPQLDQQSDSDFKFSKVPDEGLFPESEKNSIETWVSKQLNKGHIILICLLKDYDLESLKKGTIFENDKRLIVFCFKNPPINREGCICIDVDFEKAEPQHIRDNMKDLANAIKEETLS